jgi:hypothetical protein
MQRSLPSHQTANHRVLRPRSFFSRAKVNRVGCYVAAFCLKLCHRARHVGTKRPSPPENMSSKFENLSMKAIGTVILSAASPRGTWPCKNKNGAQGLQSNRCLKQLINRDSQMKDLKVLYALAFSFSIQTQSTTSPSG